MSGCNCNCGKTATAPLNKEEGRIRRKEREILERGIPGGFTTGDLREMAKVEISWEDKERKEAYDSLPLYRKVYQKLFG